MPQDRHQLLNDALHNPDFWIFTALFVAGTVTHAMKKRNQPFDIMAFIGELILATGLAFICWAFGLYHGLDSVQVALLALPSAYGQVNIVTKLLNARKGKDNGKQQSS